MTYLKKRPASHGQRQIHDPIIEFRYAAKAKLSLT
jgi:hypothetical protein